MKKIILFLTVLGLFSFCTEKEKPKENVDLIIHNATIYTVDSSFNQVGSFAVKDGKFHAVGTSKEILEKYQSDSNQVIDMNSQPVYPGFIDAHAHFMGFAKSLEDLALWGTKSMAEVISRAKEYRKKYPNKKWIVGRGWDQNAWGYTELPTRDSLDMAFGDIPVFLVRIDGHAALVNQKAIEISGLTNETKVSGGEVKVKDGKLTGILLEDPAMNLVTKDIPQPSDDELERLILEAQKRCLAEGITSLADAGLEKEEVQFFDKMHQEDKLKIGIYAMLNPTEANFEAYLEKGKYKTERLDVRSFKVYADGALGSRGAYLLEPYSDMPSTQGILINTPENLKALIKKVSKGGFQVNTHCIGDGSSRLVLDIYANELKGSNDKRWRIEHAQVVHKDDIANFGKYNIIPSVQPTHCTSDMFWADERLGEERVKVAYAFKDLYLQNNMIALGTDFPVEFTSQIYTFYSATLRQDSEGNPKNGFQMENVLSPETTLRGMTVWAAFANFQEKERGSIEVGKSADFIILDTDIMKIKTKELRNTKVKQTYIRGEKLFDSSK
jgi:predicted amidohydrolase YtcJ